MKKIYFFANNLIERQYSVIKMRANFVLLSTCTIFAVMKAIKFIIIGLLLSHLYGFAGEKRALIVAISEYPAHSGWKPINADNDVAILLNTLKKKGFHENNITVLRDSMATKQHVITAFLSLQKKADVGDFVFIHFSTHGQQMEDDNGDEPDGLDESIVCYDAKMFFSPEYKGENHLRDDEMDALLLPVRKKIGETGNLIVSLDACHSESGTRGDESEEVVRGTSVIFSQNPGYNRKNTDRIPKPPLIQENGMSPITELAATESNRLNYEFKGYGSLTYALCTVWDSYDILPAFSVWSKEIKQKMEEIRPGQTPVFRTTIK